MADRLDQPLNPVNQDVGDHSPEDRAGAYTEGEELKESPSPQTATGNNNKEAASVPIPPTATMMGKEEDRYIPPTTGAQPPYYGGGFNNSTAPYNPTNYQQQHQPPPPGGGYGTGTGYGGYDGQPVMGGVAPSHMSNMSTATTSGIPPQQQLAQQPGAVHQMAMAAASGAAPTSVIKATPESHLRATDAAETHTSVVAEMEPPMTGTQQRSLSNTICCGFFMLVIWCGVGFAVCFYGIYSALLPSNSSDGYYDGDGNGYNYNDDGGNYCINSKGLLEPCGPAFSNYRNKHAFTTVCGIYAGGAAFGVLLYAFLIWHRARKGGRMLVAYKWLSLRQPTRSLEGYMNVLQDIHTAAPVLAYKASTVGHSAVGDFRYTNWNNETTPPTLEQLRQMCGNARWVQFVPKLTTRFANGLTKHSYYQQQKEFRQINERGTVIHINEAITLKMSGGLVAELNSLRSGWICLVPGTETEKSSLTQCCCGPLPSDVVDVVNDIRTVEINFVKRVDTVAVVAHA